MLLSDGRGFQHSCNDPVRPIAPRNDFKIYLKGLLTTLMQYVFKSVHLLLRVYGPCIWSLYVTDIIDKPRVFFPPARDGGRHFFL